VDAALSGYNGPDLFESEPFARPPAFFSVDDSERIVLETNDNRFLLTAALYAVFNFFDAFGRDDDSQIRADSS